MTSSSDKANDLLVFRSSPGEVTASKRFYPCHTKSHLLFWGVYIVPPIFLTFPRNWWDNRSRQYLLPQKCSLGDHIQQQPNRPHWVKHRIAFIPTVSMLSGVSCSKLCGAVAGISGAITCSGVILRFKWCFSQPSHVVNLGVSVTFVTVTRNLTCPKNILFATVNCMHLECTCNWHETLSLTLYQENTSVNVIFTNKEIVSFAVVLTVSEVTVVGGYSLGHIS